MLLRRKRYRRRKTNCILHSSRFHGRCSRRRIPRRVRTSKGTEQNEMESVRGCRMLDQSEKIFRVKDWNSGNASIFYDSVPADCLEKVVNTRTEQILCHKVSLTPRAPPEIILKGYLESSTRRFSSASNQYGETRGGRGKDGA